jgi:hypothetical protein
VGASAFGISYGALTRPLRLPALRIGTGEG